MLIQLTAKNSFYGFASKKTSTFKKYPADYQPKRILHKPPLITT